MSLPLYIHLYSPRGVSKQRDFSPLSDLKQLWLSECLLFRFQDFGKSGIEITGLPHASASTVAILEIFISVMT